MLGGCCPARTRSSSRIPPVASPGSAAQTRRRSAFACRSSPGRHVTCSKRWDVVAATSANLHGDPDPRRLSDVPERLRAAVALILDGGDLPGTPSTVLDLTGSEPRVLREGAVPAAEALSLAE